MPDNTEANHEVVQAHLTAWCQNSTGGNWQQFRKRLARDGLDLDAVRPLLGPVHANKQYALPSWAHLLHEVLLFTDKAPEDEAAYNSQTMQVIRESATKQKVPFGEILAPFVAIAHHRLLSQSREALSLLSDQALSDLRNKLFHDLASCAVDTLYIEFSEECAPTRERENSCYRRFIAQMRSARLAAFFRKYSALARLLATLTEQWIAATAAFLQHLAADWPDIRNMLGTCNQPDQVVTIQPVLSQAHSGGRHVMALIFASGKRLVYRPETIGLEEAYYQLLAWCNQQSIVPQFKVLANLNRTDHGWIEYVEHQPCQNQQEVHTYYQRAGMLLCLIYVLGGRDCFASHIIACGEHPVLIDPGILMQPYLSSHDPSSKTSMQPEPDNGHLIDTVLHTGLLSTWQLSRDKLHFINISGFSMSETTPSLAQQAAVRSNGAANKARGDTNIPLLNNCPQGLEDYVADVLKGFQTLYHLLLKHREDLLAEKSPLYNLRQQRIRFLFRPDWIYPAIKAKLLTPTSLHDGVTQCIPVELLGLSINQREDEAGEKRWWSLYKAEQQALLRQDTPYFTIRATGIDLLLETGQKIEQCFQKPGFTLILDRLRRLSGEHLAQQIKLIQTALCTSAIGGKVSLPAEDDTRENLPTNEELTALALAIAEQVCARAVPMTNGSISWLTPQYLSSTEYYQLQPMEYSLYSGTCGVALFLATVENLTRGAGYRQVILTAMQPVMRALRKAPAHIARAMGIGGAAGLSSIVYALTRMSQLLGEPELLESAKQAAMAIKAADIESDNALDIIAGAAGAILGLMVLYDVSLEQSILDRAILCGQHLLRSRLISQGEYRVWPTFKGKCLTGFSHGVAGIAYALLRLYAVTRNASFLQAAKEGLAYEDSLFSAEAGNWPDLRSHLPTFACAWCHGAPGIGLARASGLSVLDTPQIRQDIDCALQTTQQCALLNRDHLCCGNVGRADIMLTLSIQLSRPDVANIARSLLRQVLKRAQERGAFMFGFQSPRQVYNVDLFQGMAGIGYECLRFAYPDRVPSLLLWQLE